MERSNTQSAGQPVKPATRLESVSNDMREINERTGAVLRRLRTILGRAHGPAPEGKSENGLKSVSGGILGEMTDCVRVTFESLSEIDSALEVLEATI